MTARKIFMLNFLFVIVNTVAPTAPTAAASVGDAMPAKIDPNTATIKNNGGTRALDTRNASCLAPISANSSFEIAGATLPRAAMIERDLIRDGDQVWIMDDQGNLDIRPVEIAFRARDHVLVIAGVDTGEKLVTSNLPSPVQGMALRIMGEEDQPSTSESSSQQ